MFKAFSSLALVFFLNPCCPDQPSCRKAAYVTSLSGAACVAPSRIQNIQPGTLWSPAILNTRVKAEDEDLWCSMCDVKAEIAMSKSDGNTSMSDEVQVFLGNHLWCKKSWLLSRQRVRKLVICSQGKPNQQERRCVWHYGTVRSPKRFFQHPFSKSAHRSKVDTDL